MPQTENSGSVTATPDTASARTAVMPRIWWLAIGLGLVFILTGYVRCIIQYGDLTPLIRFGSAFEQTVVPSIRAQPHYTHKGDGFDGQFYVQQGTDPLLLKPQTVAALDSYAVRGRRLLLPAITWLLSAGGQAWLALWVYPLLNLAAWLAMGWLAWRELRLYSSPLAIVAFLAIITGPGAVESASRAVPDLPTFVISCLALALPGLGGALLLSAALLGRETALLAWPGRMGDWSLWRTSWRRWLLDGAVTVAPLVLWVLILRLRFGVGERADGGNLAVPLSGLWTRLQEIVMHLSEQPVTGLADLILHPAIQCGMLIVSLLAQVIFLLRKPQWNDALWRWGVLSGLLCLWLSWVTWEAFYSITRHMLPLQMAFNLVLVRSGERGRWWWLILGNLYILPRVLFWIDIH